MSKWTDFQITRHFECKTHNAWIAKCEKEGKQQAYLCEIKGRREQCENERQEVDGTRKGCMSNPADIAFCKDTVKTFLMSGFLPSRIKGSLRSYLMKYSNKKLSHHTDLIRDNVEVLLEEECELQRMELRDKKQSFAYDATPRQGDLMAVVSRSLEVDSNTRRAFVVHTLIYVSTIKGSLNADTLSAEVNTAMMERQILPKNVPAATMDRCYTNSASVK